MPEKNGDLALYYYPGTRATRARWILEELGVDYEPVLVNLTKGAQREPGYRMIHLSARCPHSSTVTASFTNPLASVSILRIGFRIPS